MTRVMPVGGSQVSSGDTYPVRTEAVAPCDVSGYSAAEIERLFSSLEPSAVEQAGAAHTAASRTLHQIAGNLASHMSVLADSWQGQAAQAAAGNFRKLHDTAAGLAGASAQTGSVLSWLGGTILPFYKNYKAPHEGIVGDVEQFFGQHPQDKAAQQVMQRLNNRLVQADGGLPDRVTKNLPAPVLGGHTATASGGPGPGGAGSGGVTAAGGGGTAAGGGSGGAPGGPGGAVGGLGGGSGSLGRLGAGFPGRPSVTRLAGYSPPGGTGAPAVGTPVTGGAPAGSGSTGSGLFPVPGGIPGGAGGGAVDGVPGDTAGAGASDGSLGGEPDGELIGTDAVLGPDGMISGVPGDPAVGGAPAGAPGLASEPGEAASGAGPAGQDGLDMPLAGGTGQRERERYRQAWLAEDADVWAPGAAAMPSVIGG
jgi:uncharacterized protein YukE